MRLWRTPLPLHATSIWSLRLGRIVNARRERRSQRIIMKCHRAPSSLDPSVSPRLPRYTSMLLLHIIAGSSPRLLQHRHGLLTSLDPRTRGNQEDHPGGYPGVRLEEVRNPEQAEYQRDHTLCATNSHQRSRRRSPEEPRLHHSRVQNLQFAEIPAAQSIPAVGAPTSMPSSGRPAMQRPRHQSRRTFLRCAHCGTDP